MSIEQDAGGPLLTAGTGVGGGPGGTVPARISCAAGSDDLSLHLAERPSFAAPGASGRTGRGTQVDAHGSVRGTLALAGTRRSPQRAIGAAHPTRRRLAGVADASVAQTMPRRLLDAESRSWWQRLHASEPIRGWAIAELYERLRREAAFHVRQRAANVAGFPRSDIDDVATQAAGDALIALLRKLEDYRGESQFWTWARRFAALEAPVSIRRRLGRDRVGISRDPDRASDVPDPGRSAQERVESHEFLQDIGRIMRDELTGRQRTVLSEVAVNGTSTAVLAERLDTTPGAIYKSLHDARLKVRAMTAQLQPAA
jgi:RNA polymerase sigma-70 factor (ECF subfamily)